MLNSFLIYFLLHAIFVSHSRIFNVKICKSLLKYVLKIKKKEAPSQCSWEFGLLLTD